MCVSLWFVFDLLSGHSLLASAPITPENPQRKLLCISLYSKQQHAQTQLLVPCATVFPVQLGCALARSVATWPVAYCKGPGYAQVLNADDGGATPLTRVWTRKRVTRLSKFSSTAAIATTPQFDCHQS